MPRKPLCSADRFSAVAEAADYFISAVAGPSAFHVSVSALLQQAGLAERVASVFPSEEYLWLASSKPEIEASGLPVVDTSKILAQIIRYRLAGTIEAAPPGNFSLSIIPRWNRMGGGLSIGFALREEVDSHVSALRDLLSREHEQELLDALLRGQTVYERRGSSWSMRLLQRRVKLWTDLPTEDLLFDKLDEIGAFISSLVPTRVAYSPVFSGSSVGAISSIVQRSRFLLFNWAQRCIWPGPLCARALESEALVSEMRERESLWFRWEDDRQPRTEPMSGCSLTARYEKGLWILELASENVAGFRAAKRLLLDYWGSRNR